MNKPKQNRITKTECNQKTTTTKHKRAKTKCNKIAETKLNEDKSTHIILTLISDQAKATQGNNSIDGTSPSLTTAQPRPTLN